MKFKNIIFALFGIACLFVLSGFVSSAPMVEPRGFFKEDKRESFESFALEKVSQGIGEAEVRRMAVSYFERPVFYAGTSKAIYRSTAGMGRYLASLYLDSNQKQVNDFFVDVQGRAIYAAADPGLYVSRDEGESWKKIYDSEKSKAQRCLRVIVSGTRLFLGTTQGLFATSTDDLSWQAVNGYFQDKAIVDLLADQKFVYVALDSEVYRVDSDVDQIEKIFSLSSRELQVDIGTEEMASKQLIRCLALSKEQSAVILIIACDGIFYSEDSFKNWKRISHDGIPLKETLSVLCDTGKIFVAGNKGVYVFSENAWKAIYEGAETSRFSHLIKDASGDIYASSDKGIFKLVVKSSQSSSSGLSTRRDHDFFIEEPTIRQAQEMAISYAQVDPQKIKDWESQAKKKAWLPELSMGVNSDKNRTTSDNIYGSYTGGGQSYIGPDDKTFYNNLGWDVSLSWNLGDLIWNNEQTSIDSRSKMMTELRQDLLNEVTRLYFERRRLQYEIFKSTEASSDKNIERKMRLEELTALIDALTGGKFSQNIPAQERRI